LTGGHQEDASGIQPKKPINRKRGNVRTGMSRSESFKLNHWKSGKAWVKRIFGGRRVQDRMRGPCHEKLQFSSWPIKLGKKFLPASSHTERVPNGKRPALDKVGDRRTSKGDCVTNGCRRSRIKKLQGKTKLVHKLRASCKTKTGIGKGKAQNNRQPVMRLFRERGACGRAGGGSLYK